MDVGTVQTYATQESVSEPSESEAVARMMAKVLICTAVACMINISLLSSFMSSVTGRAVRACRRCWYDMGLMLCATFVPLLAGNGATIMAIYGALNWDIAYLPNLQILDTIAFAFYRFVPVLADCVSVSLIVWIGMLRRKKSAIFRDHELSSVGICGRLELLAIGGTAMSMVQTILMTALLWLQHRNRSRTEARLDLTHLIFASFCRLAFQILVVDASISPVQQPFDKLKLLPLGEAEGSIIIASLAHLLTEAESTLDQPELSTHESGSSQPCSWLHDSKVQTEVATPAASAPSAAQHVQVLPIAHFN
ncbi:unnamed protein product [Tilletia caries]|nr:hypothetical protein CF328_g6047 [Tilletia controversa]CAD6885277.1 unnamed protein product [Tilletia caries]CAD7067998.1 unnamed protein product [Tilletia caries]